MYFCERNKYICTKRWSEVKSLSRVWLFATPWTVACQAPLSRGFSRQEYWSGLPFPSPGDLPDPGIEPRSPTLEAGALTSEPPGKSSYRYTTTYLSIYHWHIFELFPAFWLLKVMLLRSFKSLGGYKFSLLSSQYLGIEAHYIGFQSFQIVFPQRSIGNPFFLVSWLVFSSTFDYRQSICSVLVAHVPVHDDLLFPDDHWCWARFHVLINHVYIFLCVYSNSLSGIFVDCLASYWVSKSFS